MPDDKSIGSKLLGLFVETDPSGETPAEGTASAGVSPTGSEKTPAEIIAELTQGTKPKASGAPVAPTSGPAPGAGHAARTAQASASATAAGTAPASSAKVEPAKVDFDAVFQRAGMDSGDLDRVRKAEALLAGLPESTPHDVKRQIVEVSLKAVGFDTERIAGAATNQLKALETYVRLNEQQTAKAMTEVQQQIAELDDKIIGLRADLERRTQQLTAVTAAAALRSDQVRRVLDFFRPGAGATPAPAASGGAKSTGPTGNA